MCNDRTPRDPEHTSAASAWVCPVSYGPGLHTWRHREAGTAYAPRGRCADRSARASLFTGMAVYLTSALSSRMPRPRVHPGGERWHGPEGSPERAATQRESAACCPPRCALPSGSAQGRVGAGAQPHKRCAPVARERTRILGGRSCAYVPGPFRVLARRRGGSGGSGGGVLVRPRASGQRVGFDGGADHDRRRCRLVAVGLNPAAGGEGAVEVGPPTRGRGGPSARPSPSHAVTTPRSPGAAAFSRRPSPGCSVLSARAGPTAGD